MGMGMGIAAEETGATRVLQFRTIHGQGQDIWTAQLAEGLFTLNAPDGRLALMLPVEAAARHIRFQRDLVHGQTVRITVLEGLKAQVFKVSPEDLEALLNWLPNRSKEDLAQEVRLYGVAFFLLATAHLLFQELLYWGWGLAFAGAGIAAVLRPHQRIYLVNGIMLGFVGLMLLFGAPFPRTGQLAQLLYTLLGSLLLLWSIQQFSLLGPYHRLRSVHDAQRESLSPGARHRSRLVQSVALCATLLAGVFVVYAGALYVAANPGAGPRYDYVVFAGLAVLLAFSAVVLYLRRYPPYLEAKIVAQLMIATAVLYAWGLAAGYALGDPLAFSRGILAAGLLRFERPYVWAPLIVLLLLFGRWFIGAAERDARRLEEDQMD